MLKFRKIATLLTLALVASSCASPPPAKIPVEVSPPELQPPPASVMVERLPNFRTRLLQIFSRSPTTPTP